MNGFVDEFYRAMIRIRLQNPRNANVLEIDAWIDTGFTGELVLPREHVTALALPTGPPVTGVVADGSKSEFNTYSCNVEWFGASKAIEVIANDGRYPLLGVGLLLKRKLVIDYEQKTLSLT